MKGFSNWFKNLKTSMVTADNLPETAPPDGQLKDVPNDRPMELASTTTNGASSETAAPNANLNDIKDDLPEEIASTGTNDTLPESATFDAQLKNAPENRPVENRRTRSPSIRGMNKTQLIAEVAKKAGLKKTQARMAVNALLPAIREALVEGDEVALPGFGIFWTKEQAAHIARNPRTGERVNLPPRKVVKFSPGQKLKEAVLG